MGSAIRPRVGVGYMTKKEKFLQSELLTPKELADHLKIHPGTLATWRFQGKRLANGKWVGLGPDFIKLSEGVNGPVRYPIAWVQDWENAQRRSSTAG